MKGLRIIAVLALLHAGRANADVGGETNYVSGQVRNLLDSAGYSFAQKTVSLPRQDMHSLRNLEAIALGPFGPLTVPVKKNGWSLWHNSIFKSTGNSPDETSVRTAYEYDITYSFAF